MDILVVANNQQNVVKLDEEQTKLFLKSVERVKAALEISFQFSAFNKSLENLQREAVSQFFDTSHDHERSAFEQQSDYVRAEQAVMIHSVTFAKFLGVWPSLIRKIYDKKRSREIMQIQRDLYDKSPYYAFLCALRNAIAHQKTPIEISYGSKRLKGGHSTSTFSYNIKLNRFLRECLRGSGKENKRKLLEEKRKDITNKFDRVDIIYAFIDTHKRIYDELVSPVVDGLPDIVVSQWEDIRKITELGESDKEGFERELENFYISSCSDHKKYPRGEDIMSSEVLERTLIWTRQIKRSTSFNLLSITPEILE